jgi:outer membrane lipoprotein-sorting protein
MKKFFILALCLLFAASFMFGCGKQETGEDTEPAAGGHPEEAADTTRMDSAMEAVDSMAGEAVEEATEAVEEAVEEAAGN